MSKISSGSTRKSSKESINCRQFPSYPACPWETGGNMPGGSMSLAAMYSMSGSSPRNRTSKSRRLMAA